MGRAGIPVLCQNCGAVGYSSAGTAARMCCTCGVSGCFRELTLEEQAALPPSMSPHPVILAWMTLVGCLAVAFLMAVEDAEIKSLSSRTVH